MEEFKKKSGFEPYDKEIVFSQAVKAGKRIYYLDVKKNRKGELFLAITESKKIANGEGEDAQFSYEKHKIFIYKEDLEKFSKSISEAIAYIKQNQPYEAHAEEVEVKEEAAAGTETPSLGEDIKIDIDF